MYHCIIPWSGGVESTALVSDCVKRGMKPFCFHVTMNGHWVKQVEAVKKMSKLLNVRVDFVEWNHPDKFINFDKTKEHYTKLWENGTPPMFFVWTNIAQLIQINNPQINRIYYGYNAGIIDTNDGMGDKHTEWVDKHFRHIEDVCGMLGIETQMSAPLGNLSKAEQWNMIPEYLREHVHTCVDATKRHCGKCMKCKEMEYMKSIL